MNMIGTMCKSTRRRNALSATLEASDSASRFCTMKTKALSIPGFEVPMVFSKGGGEPRGFSMLALIHEHGAQEDDKNTGDAPSKYNCVRLIRNCRKLVSYRRMCRGGTVAMHPKVSLHRALRLGTSPRSKRVAEVDDATSDNFRLRRMMAREAGSPHAGMCPARGQSRSCQIDRMRSQCKGA